VKHYLEAVQKMIESNHKTELLTVNEASEVLRLKPSTVRSWLLKRRVPFVKLGSRVFLRLEDCLALIEAGLRPANPAGGAA
jgi:excisionase family DNA binding protein